MSDTLVERARGVDRDQQAATLLRELGAEPDFKLQAAFAYARRRERDPGMPRGH